MGQWYRVSTPELRCVSAGAEGQPDDRGGGDEAAEAGYLLLLPVM